MQKYKKLSAYVSVDIDDGFIENYSKCLKIALGYTVAQFKKKRRPRIFTVYFIQVSPDNQVFSNYNLNFVKI